MNLSDVSTGVNAWGSVNTWSTASVDNTSSVVVNGLYPVFNTGVTTSVPAVNTASVVVNGLYPVFNTGVTTSVPAVNTASVVVNGLYPVFTSIFVNGDDSIFILPQTNFHIPYKSSNIVIQTKSSNMRI
jgi:hypothetical protein